MPSSKSLIAISKIGLYELFFWVVLSMERLLLSELLVSLLDFCVNLKFHLYASFFPADALLRNLFLALSL